MADIKPDRPDVKAADEPCRTSEEHTTQAQDIVDEEIATLEPQQASRSGCFLVENYNDVLSYVLGIFSGIIFAKDYIPGKFISVLLLVPAIVILSTFVFGYSTTFPGPTRLIIVEAVVALCGLPVAFLQNAQSPFQRSDCKMVSTMAGWMANENLWAFIVGVALATSCLIFLPLQLPIRRQNSIEAEQEAETKAETVQAAPAHDPKSYKSFIMMLKAASYIALATSIFVLTPVFQSDLKIAMIEELPFLVISAVCGTVLPLGLTSMLHKIIELQNVRDRRTQQEHKHAGPEFVDAIEHTVEVNANNDLSDTLIELVLTTVFDVAMFYCLFTVPDFTKNQKIILGYGMVIASVPVSWYSKMVPWRKTSAAHR